PPDTLYHGTGHNTAETVEREGLRKMRRHHVHLSPDVATAARVGARHGRPVVFTVDARSMAEAGIEFFCSANGVWLVEEVPPHHLRRLDP
ncbi:MAG: RNA 2'-phosphotransferase, partial [Actinomycetota bacterium]